MSKRNLCLPIMGLFFISFGGLLLHARLHPPSADAENWIPATFGVVTTFVLPLMFYCRKTATWAYLITWLAVVVGTLTMAWHSIEHPPAVVTLRSVLLETTLADILILFAKIPMAHMILKWWKKHARAN